MAVQEVSRRYDADEPWKRTYSETPEGHPLVRG